MLLVELTINAVVNYVSIDGHALTHNWKPRILTFDAPMISIPSDHGGYAKMTFGTISFNPILFQADWPPPVSCHISIYYTDTTEAAKELIFSGTCHLKEFDREQITYSIYGPSYDETIAATTAYNNTLNSVLTAILTTIPEITSVNTTYARASSPNVTHTTSDIQRAIDLASAIAEFYSHLFYIVGSTAYLVDMLLNNGTWTLTEFKFFAFPKYWYKNPVSVLYCSQYYKLSSYPYGDTMTVTPYHTTQANIEAALTDILAIENAARITLDVPMIAGNFPAPGRKIVIPDTAHVVNLSSWIRARKLRLDFINDSINIEGEGAIAAA
jgi:hypothetical protein